jgi:pimeloyl-ACP methyl ester carboxylesterase
MRNAGMEKDAMIGETVVLNDGRKLGFAAYGEKSGSPVLYFAGGIGTRLQVQPNSRCPIPPGIRLIGIDRPGLGLSDFQEGRTLLDWPEDVHQLADALELSRFSVLGVSAGGPYALACAYRLPERIHKCGLVATETPPDTNPLPPGGMRMMLWMYRSLPRITGLWFWWLYGRHFGKKEEQPSAFLHKPQKISKAFCEKDRQMWSDPEMRHQNLMDHIEACRQGTRGPAYEAGLWGQPWGFRPEEIAFDRILLWHGEKDFSVPIASVRAMSRRLPHCEACYFPDHGHSVGSYYWKEILETLGS